MNPYAYPFSDFLHGVNIDLLGRQIVDAIPSFVPVYLGCTTGANVEILFDSALSVSEEARLTAIVAAHDPTGYSFNANYHQESYSASRRLLSKTWYAVKTAGDELLYKVNESAFTYDSAGLYLLSEEWKTYNPLGAVLESKTFTYETVTDPSGSIFIRKNES